MSKWEVVKVGDWWTIMRLFDVVLAKRAGVLCGMRTGGELYEDEAKVMVEVLNKVDALGGDCMVMIFPNRGLTQG